jgi:hypothetical protein
MRQLRENGAYLRPASGARATIRVTLTVGTLANGNLFTHSRCARVGQYGFPRARSPHFYVFTPLSLRGLVTAGALVAVLAEPQ